MIKQLAIKEEVYKTSPLKLGGIRFLSHFTMFLGGYFGEFFRNIREAHFL